MLRELFFGVKGVGDALAGRGAGVLMAVCLAMGVVVGFFFADFPRFSRSSGVVAELSASFRSP